MINPAKDLNYTVPWKLCCHGNKMMMTETRQSVALLVYRGSVCQIDIAMAD